MSGNMSIQYAITQHIERLDNIDPDYRFMAFSDISALLNDEQNRGIFSSDTQTVSLIINGVVKLLDDPVADVQSQAVKCLEPLMRLVNETQTDQIMLSLSKRLRTNPEGDSITYMALRTVVCEASATPAIASVLGQHLNQILENEKEPTIDSLDVTTEYLKRFGSSLSANAVARIENYLLKIVETGRGIVRKRAVVAMGYLVRYLDKARWEKLVAFITNALDSDPDHSSAQTLVFLTGILAKNDPVRFRRVLALLFEKVVKSMKLENLGDADDSEDEGLLETREAVMTALESFVELGTHCDPYIEQILQIVATFLVYDPNYNQDEDDDDDVEMGGSSSDDEFELSDEEGFSEDDDLSWKLRRYSCRLASAVVKNNSTFLPMVYNKLLELFIKRASAEREETVKAEVLVTLAVFIKAAEMNAGYYTSKLYTRRRSSDASMAQDTDPQAMLDTNSGKIVKMADKECSKTSCSPNILHAYVGLLQALITVVEGIDSESIGTIITVLSNLAGSKNQMMTDVLKSVSSLYQHQSTDNLDNDKLLWLVIKGINDEYYKVSSEGLDVASEVFDLYQHDSAPHFAAAKIEEIETGILEKATSNAQDIETREKAVRCLGKLLSVCPLICDAEKINKGFQTLIELLSNESLRVSAIGSIEQVAKSDKELSQQLVDECMEKLCTFLKQSSKPLRLSSLTALKAFAARGSGSEANATQVIAHGQTTLENEVDTQVLADVAQILAHLSKQCVNSRDAMALFGTQTASATKAESYQTIPALLELFGALAANYDTTQTTALYEKLVNMPNSLVSAQCIAAVITGGLPDKINDWYQNLSNRTESLHSLHVLGSVGKQSDMALDIEPIVQEFTSLNDRTQSAAAQAAGEITTNRLDYLPKLISGLKNRNWAPLYLIAVREVIVSDKLQDIPIATVAEIWNVLFTLEIEDESIMTKVAECVGRLSILNPEKCLPELQSSLKNEQWSMRAIALSAVKYSFGQSHDTYDNLLRPVVIDFMGLIQDQDMKIRQVAMSTLVAAIHNKHHLLVPHLSMLIPVLLKETVVNKDLIRTVRFGPFKHKVDDGLELRKTAYEAIYTLLATLTPEMLDAYADLDQIFRRVLAGLTDEHDIKVLCCVIVARVAEIDFAIICTAAALEEGGPSGLEQLIQLFQTMHAAIVKENDIKQEFEKQQEVKRNVERTWARIDQVIKSADDSGTGAGISDVERQSWQNFRMQLFDTKKK